MQINKGIEIGYTRCGNWKSLTGTQKLMRQTMYLHVILFKFMWLPKNTVDRYHVQRIYICEQKDSGLNPDLLSSPS